MLPRRFANSRRAPRMGRHVAGARTVPAGARKLPPGTSLLLLATPVTAATLGLVWPRGNAIYCERLPPLAVLAVLAGALVALGFRVLATAHRRSIPVATLALAALSLFASARFVARYHAPCASVEQQLKQQRTPRQALPRR